MHSRRTRPFDRLHVTSVTAPSTLILLRRWHAGDAAALEALIALHLPRIREHVERRVGPLLRMRADADDYVQDVLLRILLDGPRFEVQSAEHLRMLLARLVENTLRDNHKWFSARRRTAAKERPLPPTTILTLDPSQRAPETPRGQLDAQEKEAWIRLALDLLDSDSRELIVLHEWDRLTFAQIGNRLGITEGAARVRCQRAVAKLTLKMSELRRGRIESALRGEADDAPRETPKAPE